MYRKISNLLRQGSERTFEAKKNIILSFMFKGLGIVVSFLLVPLTLHYLNTSEYGIWLTLSSILTWVNYFDIGLSNGLRNKLAEALSLGDNKLAKTYVSTAFVLLAMIVLAFFIIFFVASFFLHWDTILNTAPTQREMLGKLVIIVFAFFCLQFIFKIVGTILIANQKPAYNDLLFVAGNLLSLVVIFILTRLTAGNLAYVAVTFSAAPVVVFVVACVVLFFGKYKFLRPSISAVRFEYAKGLVGLGLQFFIIQLAVCVVIYSSTNIIIAQLFGSESVTIYNIAFKYFSVLIMLYTIVITPFWTAATDAYAKNELEWIRSSIKKLLIIFAVFMAIIVFMIFFANIFYRIWVGASIAVPLSLSAMVAFYTAIYIWSNTFIYFINGIGKIRLQLYITVTMAILYIPMAIYFGKQWGVNGVVFATAISQIPVSIFMPLQCVKLYSNKAKGVWNK